ncbi:DJC22-like protein [Mya arenaria]|uniref:DnaJ homolog subfamily C member 22 n=1 Tax=Mya arenaria TaxID=6604 RepID=A0ABY7ELI0_MYAAR|nr:DJC22-like protein [Mya arenaria]
MANIVVAYIFWLFGGPFGLHHFYLGRDRQAFVWWISLGGLFLGWFRDLWRLPEYIYEANRDPRFVAEFADRRRRHEKPPWSIVRFAGQIFIGMLLGYLFRLAIAEKVLQEFDPIFKIILSVVLPVLGTSVGVKLVANIGHRKCNMKWCVLGAMISIPWLLNDQPSVSATALFSSFLASYKTEWDPDRKRPKGACTCIKRATVLTFCCCIYVLLWTSAIVFNVHVTTSDGTEVPIEEALKNFFNSPAWKDFKKSFWEVYNVCNTKGWDFCYRQILEFEGESPTPEQIKSRCRKLGSKWHPDKHKTKEEKKVAQEKFIEIQQACDILNTMRKRRTEKNMETPSSTEQSSDKHSEL